MTVLAWNITADRIEVVCDTLSVNQDLAPILFTSKVTLASHLGVAIASTGSNEIASRWTLAAQTRVQARGFDDLDRVAPDYLRRLHTDLAADWPGHEIDAEVYHFGRSERTGRFVGHVFSSDDDYEPEVLPDGLGVRPGLRADVGDGGPITIIDVALAVREQQLERPASERAHIGGELILTSLSDAAIRVMPAHRFDDFDDQWNAMQALAGAQHEAARRGETPPGR